VYNSGKNKEKSNFFEKLNIRIKPETHSAIAALSKQAGESINAFIGEVLDTRVAAML
jgi:predicted HicB family RNase H-like nuclease